MIPMQPKQVTDSQSLNDISSDEEMDAKSLQGPGNLSPLVAKDFDSSPASGAKKQSSVPDFDRMQEFRHKDTFQLVLQINEVNKNIVKQAAPQPPPNRELLKELVSKEKRRFMLDGFNLDLTYITLNIIAMGFPAESFESLYRNSMHEVQRFLNTRHPKSYRVYNLCSERKYSHDHFFSVVEYPFDDHQAPPFRLIGRFCQDVHDWLWASEENVAAIHCKAGKGRTGVMICCYLLFSKMFDSAKDALKYYGLIRTENAKGVTIPSQIRYVEYFSFALRSNQIFRAPSTLELVEVRLIGMPTVGLFGGCGKASNDLKDPFLRLQNRDAQLVAQPMEKSEHGCVFKFQTVHLIGDVLIQIFHQSIVSEQKLFQAWFHTNFVNLKQVFTRQELDGVAKDKHHKKFPPHMELILCFSYPVENRRRSNCIQIQMI